MLDATKYINRLRVIINEEADRRKFVSRVEDVVRDYDRDFDEAMEKMEIEEMLNMKRGDPYAEGTG